MIASSALVPLGILFLFGGCSCLARVNSVVRAHLCETNDPDLTGRNRKTTIDEGAGSPGETLSTANAPQTFRNCWCEFSSSVEAPSRPKRKLLGAPLLGVSKKLATAPGLDHQLGSPQVFARLRDHAGIQRHGRRRTVHTMHRPHGSAPGSSSCWNRNSICVA
jgi:hypothetical protein